MISGAIYSTSLVFFRNGNKPGFDRFIKEVLAFVLPGMNAMLSEVQNL
jgi:hypothetical protein